MRKRVFLCGLVAMLKDLSLSLPHVPRCGSLSSDFSLRRASLLSWPRSLFVWLDNHCSDCRFLYQSRTAAYPANVTEAVCPDSDTLSVAVAAYLNTGVVKLSALFHSVTLRFSVLHRRFLFESRRYGKPPSRSDTRLIHAQRAVCPWRCRPRCGCISCL